MNQDDLRQRLSDGKTCLGGWLTAPSPWAAEAMASCGFHWIAVDMEHGTPSVNDAAAAFLAAERRGAVPLARLPSADPYLARRLLDAGAHGLIVPVVEDADDFRAFMEHCLFPPQGKRGVGLSRCNTWGDDFSGHLTDFKPLLVPQIETLKGVNAVGELSSIPEVDALFLGPYDLSASLEAPGEFATAEFRQAIGRIKEAAAEWKTPLGIHQVEPDPAALKQQEADGFRFIAYSTDLIAMRHALKSGTAVVTE